MSFGGEKQRGQESQPLVHDGRMFVTASYSRIFAIDTKTGAKLWKYEHRLPEGIMPCCDVVNRGAALLPGLDRDLVSAPGQRLPERDRGKDVARIAEGGEQKTQARGGRSLHRGYGPPIPSPGRVKTISGTWQ